MRSSISSSESSHGKVGIDRFTIVLLSTIVAIVILAECGSRAWFDKTSRVQRRELSERHALLSVRDTQDIVDPHIALLGNSLMLDGVNLTEFGERVGRKYVPTPYFVLGTNYYDWYFGLKRLFAEGMRPKYVVLGLSPNQLATSSIRGEMSARYLFQRSDLMEVVRKTHMSPTVASEFLLAYYSEYLSTRDTTRGFVMSSVFPSVGQLLHNEFATFRDPEVEKPVLERVASERLGQLNRLCQEYGSHFIFVIPPTYQKGEQTIALSGWKEGTRVLVPVRQGEFDSSYYQSDGFHLNDKGALIFTARLTDELKSDLGN